MRKCLCTLDRAILVFISQVAQQHQNNTRVSTWSVRHKSIYIILFLTWHNESINDDKSDDHPHVSFTRFTYCWWCHNWLLMMSQWPDHCDMSTRKMSESITIYYMKLPATNSAVDRGNNVNSQKHSHASSFWVSYGCPFWYLGGNYP